MIGKCRQKVGGSAFGEYGFRSWSNSQFKFEVNTAGLNTSEPVYLYVTNWEGKTNSIGYQLSGAGGDDGGNADGDKNDGNRSNTNDSGGGCFVNATSPQHSAIGFQDKLFK